MAKRQFTQADMDKIDQLYLENTEQSKVLKDILLCLKGDESLNIEGVIPAQKRVEHIIETKLATKQEIKEVKAKVSEMDDTLKQLNAWKQIVSVYFSIMLSKKVWKGIGFTVAVIVIVVLSVKYGFQTVWHYIKGLFL